MSPELPPDALAAQTPLFGGQYQVDSMLGRGGFGLTYLCAEPSLLRWVAVKELFPPGATRNGKQVIPPRGVSADDWTKAKNAFVAEARRLSTFADPCIVRVYGVWEENGTAYMAMEALDGGSLLARLKANGVMSPIRVAQLGLSLCRVLAILHHANLLHRDLKPENIFFAADESPILIDFGNARNLVAHQTQTVSLALTPGYAPPEAYSSSATLTPASDIYALGATLWECLTGSPPPDATDRTLGAPLPILLELVPGCPPLLAACLEQALALKPEERFSSAEAFAAQLGGALQSAQQFSVRPVFDTAPPTLDPAMVPPPNVPDVTWSTALQTTPCAFCGQPVPVEDSICPHCGRFKNGYVPGQHLKRRRQSDQTVFLWMWMTGIAIAAVLMVGSVFRVSRALRPLRAGTTATSGGGANSYDDSPQSLRLQSTQLRRELANTDMVYSVRPEFRSGSIDIVASVPWQQLSRDDKLNMARTWAQRWRDMRAPLPAPFQITDLSGRVLGGRTTGANDPWVR